jgi:arsenate reductase
MAEPLKILFVCIGNSCRSQMAEALARHLASDVMLPASAGVSPLGNIAEDTRAVLRERGVSVDGQYSKGFNDPSLFVAQLIVNMSGIPGKSLFPAAEAPATEVIDWDVEDPYGGGPEIHRQTCDDVEARVRELAEQLRARQGRAPS